VVTGKRTLTTGAVQGAAIDRHRETQPVPVAGPGSAEGPSGGVTMKVTGRRALLLGMAVAAASCCGCDAATLAYFLSPETKEDPELAKVVNADKKKVSRILILPFLGIEQMETEFIQADRELANLLAKQLTDICETNGDKITVVSPYKVEEYKSKHPAWRDDSNPAAIGRQFGADYVVVVEIQSMSMYEQGSARQIYRGRMNLSVALVDVKHPDNDPQNASINSVFPSDAKAELADADMPPAQFRTKLLKHVAKEIAYKFLPHQKSDLIDVD
jgi:hypothetical protein